MDSESYQAKHRNCKDMVGKTGVGFKLFSFFFMKELSGGFFIWLVWVWGVCVIIYLLNLLPICQMYF